MGLDLGLEKAGWECVFANEHDKVACQTIRLNRPELNLSEVDVRELDKDAVLAAIEGRRSRIDAVVGGPPCQAFSTAGKRLGLNDERGNVFLHFIDLALALSPNLILIENVRGLLSAPLSHRPHVERGFGFAPLSPSEMRGGALSHILSVLRLAGFEVTFSLYDSANFGVPQRRERLVLVASRIGKAPYFTPTHGQGQRIKKWRTFDDAVQGLSSHHEYSRIRESQLKFIKLLKPGQNWRSLPTSLQREAMGKSFECTGGRTGFLRRLDWDKPSPTLVTSPTMPATLLAHPAEDRPLSVQEYARIQTFPDDWEFAGTTAQKYRQIGNAVPVEFGRLIGAQLAEWMRTGAKEPTKGAHSRYSATSDESWAPAV